MTLTNGDMWNFLKSVMPNQLQWRRHDPSSTMQRFPEDTYHEKNLLVLTKYLSGINHNRQFPVSLNQMVMAGQFQIENWI
jgi:hypothetical protein